MTGRGSGGPAPTAHLSRLLALLPYLLARPGVGVAQAARDFGVTEARLRRDLELLWVCGLPGHGPGDLIDLEFEGDTVTVLEPQGVVRPLRLTVDEALALLVALRALAGTPGLQDRDAVDRALAKVEQAAGAAAAPASRVEVALVQEAEQRALPLLRQAVQERRRLRLRYWVPTRDETTDREVDPLRVLVVDGRAYLEAWCRRAEGVRLFRADRVESAELLDVPAEPPVAVPERDLSAGVFVPGEHHPEVELALGPGAHWVADYHPVESAEPGADGELVVRLRVADLAFARRLVLGLGGAVRVVGPAELAAQVRDAAREALGAYGDDAVAGVPSD